MFRPFLKLQATHAQGNSVLASASARPLDSGGSIPRRQALAYFFYLLTMWAGDRYSRSLSIYVQDVPFVACIVSCRGDVNYKKLFSAYMCSVGTAEQGRMPPSRTTVRWKDTNHHLLACRFL